MNVSEAIASRHSVRAFLDQPVDKELITDESHTINRWRTERAPLEEFVEWHGL
jgi:hypothetical protein